MSNIESLREALDELDATGEWDWQEFQTDAVVTFSGFHNWHVHCTKHGSSAGGPPCYYCAEERQRFWKQQEMERDWAKDAALRKMEAAARAIIADNDDPPLAGDDLAQFLDESYARRLCAHHHIGV